MAKLVTRLQRVRTPVIKPLSGYSRWVTCGMFIKDPAVRSFSYTEVVGGSLWLLGVQVHFNPWIWAGLNEVSFYVLHGSGVPTSPADIMNWTQVLPVKFEGGIMMGWSVAETLYPFSWEMKQLWEGQAQRFGIWAEVSPGMPVLEVRCSFHISEG